MNVKEFNHNINCFISTIIKLTGSYIVSITIHIYIFFRFFATVHSLMKDISLIDSCQAHLPVHYRLQTTNSFARGDTGVMIDSKPHLSRTC